MILIIYFLIISSISFLALRDKLLITNVDVPEDAVPGIPGEVAILAKNFNSDCSSLKWRRALKQLHYVFAPVARIEMGSLSESTEATHARDRANAVRIVNPFSENTILRMSNNDLIMLPLESDLAHPFYQEESEAVVPTTSTSTTTTSSSSQENIPHQLRLN